MKRSHYKMRPAASTATCYRCREPSHDPNAATDTVTGFRPRTICAYCLPGEIRRTAVFLMRHRFIGGRDPDCVLDLDPRLRFARERFRADVVDHWRHPEIPHEQRAAALRCRTAVEARLRRNQQQRCVPRVSPEQFKKCRERRDAEYRCALKLPTAGKLPNQLGVALGHDRGSFQNKDGRRRLADAISAAALYSPPTP